MGLLILSRMPRSFLPLPLPIIVRETTKQSSNEMGIMLIELLLLLLLISLTIFTLTPLYHSLRESIALEIATFHLKQDLQMAKILASLEERSLSICGSQDGRHCLEEESGIWPGWLLFYDDQQQFIPTEETILHYYPLADRSQQKLIITTTTNIGGGLNISARRNYGYGMARALPNGRINICHQNLAENQQISFPSFIINVYGYFRLTHEKGSC